MDITPVILEGKRVRLEPMTLAHLPALAEIIYDPDIWRWIPQRMETEADLRAYMDEVLTNQRKGTELPWITRDKSSGNIVGCTGYMDVQHVNCALEIGASWLTRACQGTGVNTEAKYLQLQYAFETIGANRVALHTHHRNLQSQAAIRALGAKLEGTLRNHIIMPDGSVRHTVCYSIIREEWPEVKVHLQQKMARFSTPSPRRESF